MGQYDQTRIYEHQDEAAKLKDADNQQLEWFIQEVRRFYLFFPFAVARLDLDFEQQGYTFKESTSTLLDLYGTNRHPDDSVNPEVFSLERF